MNRRTVRTSPALFEQLDLRLGDTGGPNGEPSATDFLVFELPAIVEAFATRFDELPEAVEGKRAMARRFAWPSLVVGTGVDPVTFRFSGGRSTN